MSPTRKARLAVLCATAMLCAACYVSPVPMSEKKLPVDERILGYWVDEEEGNRYHVARADGQNYRITAEQFDSDSGQWQTREMPAFLTRIKDQQILNVWIEPDEEDKDEDPGYVFLKYEVETGEAPRVRFWVMAEEPFRDENHNTITFDSSKKLRKFVKPLLSRADEAELWLEEPTVLVPVAE